MEDILGTQWTPRLQPDPFKPDAEVTDGSRRIVMPSTEYGIPPVNAK